MNRLVVLVISACLTVGSAYFLAVYRHAGDAAQSQLLFGGLSDNALNLFNVKVENNQGVIFSATKEGNQWMATHLDSLMRFPADVSKLANFVNELTQARILEPKTALAKQYSQLGVEPITKPGANSTLITISSQTEQWKVLLGNLSSSGVGRYVREPSQPKSYLIDKQLELPITSADWLTPNVVNIGLADLDEVIISGQDSFTLAKTATNEWELQDNELPLAYPGVLVHTLNDIINFEYESVSPYVNPLNSADLVRSIRLNTQGNYLDMAIYSNAEQGGGYLMRVTGDLQLQNVQDWLIHLTDFQGRGLLSAKSELVNLSAQ